MFLIHWQRFRSSFCCEMLCEIVSATEIAACYSLKVEMNHHRINYKGEQTTYWVTLQFLRLSIFNKMGYSDDSATQPGREITARK